MKNESASLAPASGAGVGKLVAEALLSDPTFVQKMRDAFLGALEAENYFVAKGSSVVESRPDFRVRLQAVMGVLAHLEGEPIKRVLHQHMSAGGEIDLLATLRDSPALASAAAALLEKARFRSSPGERSAAKARERRAEAAAIEVS